LEYHVWQKFVQVSILLILQTLNLQFPPLEIVNMHQQITNRYEPPRNGPQKSMFTVCQGWGGRVVMRSGSW
jgi:hypothetical protein